MRASYYLTDSNFDPFLDAFGADQRRDSRRGPAHRPSPVTPLMMGVACKAVKTGRGCNCSATPGRPYLVGFPSNAVVTMPTNDWSERTIHPTVNIIKHGSRNGG